MRDVLIPLIVLFMLFVASAVLIGVWAGIFTHVFTWAMR